MDEDYKNKYIKQIYDDLSAHTKGTDLEVDVEQAVNDFGEAFAAVKTDKEKSVIMDEAVLLMYECAGKIAAGLEATPDAHKAERIAGFSKVLLKGVEFNPKNAERLMKAALKIDAAHPQGSAGLFSDFASKIIVKYPRQSETVLNVADEYTAEYAKRSRKDAKTYDDLYKVYTTAFRKPFSGQIQKRAIESANKIFYEIDFLKNGAKLDKDIKRINDNPDDEQWRDLFESHLEIAMKRDPQKAVEDIMENIKAIAQIENEDNRGEVYGLVLGAMAEGLSADGAEAIKNKSTKIMAYINKAMRTEKNPELKESLAISAMYALRNGLVDENGGFIFAEGQENQTFGALNKMAEAAGYRPEIKEMLAGAAETYRSNAEMTARIKETMIKALASEDASKKTMNAEYEQTMFEKRMRNVYAKLKNTQRLNNEIATLLNLEYGGYKYDTTRSIKASKKEMEKAVNKLSEYSQISDHLPSLIIGKMDTEQFTNVDDKILDKFINVSGRIKSDDKAKEAEKQKYREEIVSKIQSVRAQMHAFGVKEKNKIKFSKDDMDIGDAGMKLKGVELEKLAEKKTPADHAPKKFSITFDKDAKTGEER